MIKLGVEKLTEAQSTLLMPLWARAMEFRRAQPLLVDRKAIEMVETLDFDFDQFIAKKVPQADYCIRATVIDQLVQEFLVQHPEGTVVEFGVGLDTRFDRMDNGTVTWIELDLPHVIELRERFFEATDRRHILRGSLTDSAWVDQVQTLVRGPVMFVAEGVLYFLSDPQVDALLNTLVDRFPRSSFVFDAQSPWYLWFSNLRQPVKDAQMQFSVGRVSAWAARHPRLSVHRWIGYGDQPYYQNMLSRLGPVKRWGRKLCPPVRSMFKVLDLRWM